MWRFGLLLLLTSPANPADFNSYCKGYCQARYQDGFFSNGKCGCVDYFQVNLEQHFPLPKQKNEHPAADVYDGKDKMHYAPSE